MHAPQLIAQEAKPASAIPWLTQSLTAEEAQSPDSRQPSSTEIETISVKKLSDNGRDGLGILTSDITGFPTSLWDGLTPERAKRLLASTNYGGVPANMSLFRRLLLAESEPPTGEMTEDSFLVARIDRLLEIGALGEAQALIEVVGPETSELFRRWFDIGLLTNQSDAACAELTASPMLSPARTVKIFCLALSREWDAAATSLTLGEELGEISKDEADLLAFFLDESLLEEIDPPAIGSPISSLEFIIRESVGLPRPTTRLPTAFLHAELADYVPLRFRIEAAEALVREGVVPASVLFAAYREEVPAASGGVWERLAAIQEMDQAATAEDISDALRKLDYEFGKANLRAAAGHEFLLYLSELPADEFDEETRSIAVLFLLLGGAPELAQKWATDAQPDELKTALSIATGSFDGNSELENVLSTSTPEAYLSDFQSSIVSNGRVGEALLLAIDTISKGSDLDEDDFIKALALLRSAGQDKVARDVAVQTLLLPLEINDAN